MASGFFECRPCPRFDSWRPPSPESFQALNNHISRFRRKWQNFSSKEVFRFRRGPQVVLIRGHPVRLVLFFFLRFFEEIRKKSLQAPYAVRIVRSPRRVGATSGHDPRRRVNDCNSWRPSNGFSTRTRLRLRRDFPWSGLLSMPGHLD